MSLQETIELCEEQNVGLHVNGDLLDVSFDEPPSPHLIELIKKYKKDLILMLNEHEEGLTKNQRPKITRSNDKVLELSYSQRLLCIMEQLGENNAKFNMNYALNVKGDFDLNKATDAFQLIIERHEPLRTKFMQDRWGNIHAETKEKVDFRIDVIELDNPQQHDISEIIQKDAQTAFDISNDLLLRVTYILVGEYEGMLLINMHHIASDGWSVGILIEEFVHYYQAGVNELESTSRPPLSLRYSDFSNWQNHATLKLYDEQLAYWEKQLKGMPQLHSVPTDYTRPSVQTNNCDQIEFYLSEEISKRLASFAKKTESSVFIVLHAVFTCVISRFSQTPDIAIGTLTANRAQKELESVIGFFANSIVLRSNCDEKLSFLEYLEYVKSVNLEALSNQDVPFEKVVERVNPVRNNSYPPLVQIMMSLDNSPKKEINLPDLLLTPEDIKESYSLFDLTLKIKELNQKTVLSFIFNPDIFKKKTISYMGKNLIKLLGLMLSEPNTRIIDHRMTTKDEEEFVERVNSTETNYPEDMLVHELFESSAVASPSAVALEFDGHQMSYRELNERSNQLAHLLRIQGVHSEVVVGVYMDRSIDLVVALLAILKAGGAYLPLSPSLPKNRLRYMISDSSAKLILGPAAKVKELIAGFVKVLDIDEKSIKNELEASAKTNVKKMKEQCPQNLAYVIYTSGSTGMPKGVMVEHKALVNRLDWMQKEFRVSDSDVVLQKTPFSFDVSAWEFFLPLISGSKMVLAKPEGHKDPEYLIDLSLKMEVTIIHFVPSMYRVLLEKLAKKWSLLTKLRYVICSGEALKSGDVSDHYSFSSATLVNLYGPTEATIDVSYWVCNYSQGSSVVPIGRPIQNTKLVVFNEHHKPVPIGAAGELYISGDGLARGYINNPDLTKINFIHNSVSNGPEVRWYKTGDLVRLNHDGDLEYLGRIDQQIKIRGFRVEVAEIEHHINKLEFIESSIVTTSKAGEQLICYIVLRNVSDLEDDELELSLRIKAELSQELPEYMVPARYIVLDKMPLTHNGKLNIDDLPEPEEKEGRRAFAAPRSDTELRLNNIWSELLEVSPTKISIDDDFFELGGHSLTLVKLKAHINESFSINFPMNELFTHSTIKQQSQMIDLFNLTKNSSDTNKNAYIEDF